MCQPKPASDQSAVLPVMAPSQLRHEIRNHLNSIKLHSALLQRRLFDSDTIETLREIDHAADRINELVTHCLAEREASQPGGR